MCAEFAMRANRLQDLSADFRLTDNRFVNYRESYFPNQVVAVVGRKPGTTARGMIGVRWGLVPNWYADREQRPQPFNARSETVATSGLFRDAFRSRRCLIPAEAFYEWSRARPKRRYEIRPRGGVFFGLAGIWDTWAGDATQRPVLSACMLTCPPNDVIGAFHDRMPVVLRPDDYDRWLDAESPVAELRTLLTPYPADLMECEHAPRPQVA
jgi:putative SOS response-associated peptidase YedK